MLSVSRAVDQFSLELAWPDGPDTYSIEMPVAALGVGSVS
jgi:hypothetical protein